VINQIAGPENTSDVFYFTRVLLFIVLISMGYELSRPQTANKKEQDILLTNTVSLDQDPKWPSLLPWQKNASEKAVERYSETQEKKWRRWNEAMFERSG
jgi:hypothetical protein